MVLDKHVSGFCGGAEARGYLRTLGRGVFNGDQSLDIHGVCAFRITRAPQGRTRQRHELPRDAYGPMRGACLSGSFENGCDSGPKTPQAVPSLQSQRSGTTCVTRGDPGLQWPSQTSQPLHRVQERCTLSCGSAAEPGVELRGKALV